MAGRSNSRANRKALSQLVKFLAQSRRERPTFSKAATGRGKTLPRKVEWLELMSRIGNQSVQLSPSGTMSTESRQSRIEAIGEELKGLRPKIEATNDNETLVWMQLVGARYSFTNAIPLLPAAERTLNINQCWEIATILLADPSEIPTGDWLCGYHLLSGEHRVANALDRCLEAFTRIKRSDGPPPEGFKKYAGRLKTSLPTHYQGAKDLLGPLIPFQPTTPAGKVYFESMKQSMKERSYTS